MTNYLLIDGNSLGHFSQNGAKLKIGETEVHAIYYFLRNLHKAASIYRDYTPVVLWDGVSWRKLLLNEYKENRDRQETKNEIKLALEKDGYKKQLPYIKKALRMLGIAQVFALNMEADDLGAMLADKYSKAGKVILYTGDKDWIQLISPNVIWRDFINKRSVTVENFEEFTGVKTVRQFIEVKALSGDQGDNVPGVGGVGEKGAVEFLTTYGSFNNFLNMVTLEKTVDFKKLPKKFRDLVEDESKAIAFDRNIALMDLRTPKRPIPINLTVDKGNASVESFSKLCSILLFKSILDNMDHWVETFPALRTPVAA